MLERFRNLWERIRSDQLSKHGQLVDSEVDAEAPDVLFVLSKRGLIKRFPRRRSCQVRRKSRELRSELPAGKDSPHLSQLR